MAQTEKASKLSDEELAELETKLQAHRATLQVEAAEEAKAKYSDVYTFLKSKPVADLQKEVAGFSATMATTTEDRNLYFALENIGVAIEAAKAALDQRARALNTTFD